MRRALLLTLSAVLACLAPLAVSPAHALTPPITGTLFSASGDFTTPLEGATVELYSNNSGAPGALVSSDTSASDGTFSLAVASGGPKYFIKVTRPDYHEGFVGDHYVQTDVTYADKFVAGDDTGEIYMVPSTIRGYVVNPATGRRVSGVRVTARGQNDLAHPEAADTTNNRGVFELHGIECEDDCYLYFRGNPVHYENGYRACNGGVVSTWGAACASPLGYIGKVRLEHL